MADAVVTFADLGEVWKIEVQKTYIGTAMRQEWGARLYSAGPTGRWRKQGLIVVSPEGPTQAVRDLMSTLDAGLLRR